MWIGGIVVQFAEGLPNMDMHLLEKVSDSLYSPREKSKYSLLEKSRKLRQEQNRDTFEKFLKDPDDEVYNKEPKCDQLYSFFFEE